MIKIMSNEGSPETIVGASLTVEGVLNSGGDLRVDGKVKGSIITEGTVTVGDQANIEADITAANTVIAGNVKGNLIIGGRTTLKKSATLVGNISTDEIEIEAGAKFNGKCKSGSSKNSATDSGTNIEKPNRLKDPKLAPINKLAEQINSEESVTV